MTVLFNFIVLLIGTIELRIVLKRIINKNNNILDICFVVFYAMQILPLLVEIVTNDIDSIKDESMIMYYAMTDDNTSYIYDTFLLLTIFFFHRITHKKDISTTNVIDLVRDVTHRLRINTFFSFILMGGIFIPLFIAVYFSPNSDVYSQFSYFYTHELSRETLEYLYHTTVVSTCSQLTLASILLSYFFQNKRKYNYSFIIYLGIIMLTWVDGKRAMLIYALLGILMIDYIKSAKRNHSLIKKSVLFLFITISYFFVYSNITDKGSNSSFFVEYSCYFSRLSPVKVAIYDSLYTQKILEYTGQSVLFDLFYFVPRSFWENKPVMFCRYFTGYAYTGDGSQMLTGNLHVNLWSEYIANFGLWGYWIATCIVYLYTKIINKTKNIIGIFCGTFFILSYFMFGFESIVIVAYTIWLLTFLFFRNKSFL